MWRWTSSAHLAGRASALSLMLFAACVLAACQGPHLMPTPNVYVQTQSSPFADVTPLLRTNTVDILYVTDRRPQPHDDGNLAYGYGRSPSLAVGSCVIEIGENISWDTLVEQSLQADRSQDDDRVWTEDNIKDTTTIVSLPLEPPKNRSLMLGYRQSFLVRLGAVLLTVCLAAIGSGTSAQNLEPRTYANTPVGLNFLIAGYSYATGSVVTDPALPLENASVQTHGALLAYARALDLWGKSGKVDVVLPYTWVSGSAEFAGQMHERDVSGFGDPQLRVSVNLYGAPALSLKELVDYRQDLIVGASLQVSAPLGQYDADRLLNIGTNRWTIKPELGISKAMGPFTLELAASVSFYTDNGDFFGGQTREQAPIYAIQGHGIYSLRSGIWLAVDGTYYMGGRTTIDGVEGNDLQNNWRVGLTVALPVNRHNSLKLYASTGVYTRTSGDFDMVGVAWQYRWGGGL